MKNFESVIGYDDIKLELSRVLDTVANPEKYKALGVKVPSGILLYGAPGVGKTLLATSFVKASGRPYFVCRKDRPNGEFVNEIRNVFEKAREAAPSIVMLDDLDKFANSDRNSSNNEEYVTVQSCIDEIKNDGKEVFVLATANNIKNLPDSLIRAGRFDKNIEVGTPNLSNAVGIIRHYLSGKPIVSDLDYEELARILQGRSCAELESVINEAGIYSGYEGRELITKDDVLKAVMRTVFGAPESIEKRPEGAERRIAVHEAGHALVAQLLDPDGVSIVSINSYSGGVGGITSYYQDEGYWFELRHMENRVMALLGGRAATEIRLGEVDTGATSDVRRAFDIVERFVSDYCIHGFDKIEKFNSSQTLYEKKEDFIHAELDRYYLQVKRMICENLSALDRITEALMERKTITGRDIRRLRGA